MAKATRKKKVRRAKKASAPKKEGGARKPTITALVIATLESDKGRDISNSDLYDLVIRKFPDRAFDTKHASWYRSRFKNKLIPGQKGYVGSDRKAGSSKKKSKKKVSRKKTAKKKKVRRKAKEG